MIRNNISLRRFSHFSLLLMELFLRILLLVSWLKCKFRKLDVFMGFKWWWKIFTVKRTLFSLILTFKITKRRISYLKPSKPFLRSNKKQIGHWDGSEKTLVSQLDSLLLLVLKVYFSLAHFVLSFGWRKEEWCLVWHFQMS